MAGVFDKIKSEKHMKKHSVYSEPISFSRSMKRLKTNPGKKMIDNFQRSSLENEVKVENCNFQTKYQSRHARVATYSETYAFLDKAKYFTTKLAHLISSRPVNSEIFDIYSKIYVEFADSFPEFKDFLLSLRKGLVVSAIKEKNFENFEFRDELESNQTELKELFHKERQEKFRLVTKLNNLTEEYTKIKQECETLKIKVEGYEKAWLNNPIKYIEAENLVQKMLKQCEIIEKQKNIINELKGSELKLKKILERLEMYGVDTKNFAFKRENTILNPKCIKSYNRSRTLITAQNS